MKPLTEIQPGWPTVCKVSLRDGRLENTREKRMWFEWKFGELPIVESNTFLKSTWTLLRSLRENLLSAFLTYFHGMPYLWLAIIEYIWFLFFPAIFVIHFNCNFYYFFRFLHPFLWFTLPFQKFPSPLHTSLDVFSSAIWWSFYSRRLNFLRFVQPFL